AGNGQQVHEGEHDGHEGYEHEEAVPVKLRREDLREGADAAQAFGSLHFRRGEDHLELGEVIGKLPPRIGKAFADRLDEVVSQMLQLQEPVFAITDEAELPFLAHHTVQHSELLTAHHGQAYRLSFQRQQAALQIVEEEDRLPIEGNNAVPLPQPHLARFAL